MLEVEWSNDAAIALYQRLGFEQLFVRRGYYGPARDALILKLYDLEDWPGRFAAAVADTDADLRREAGRPLSPPGADHSLALPERDTRAERPDVLVDPESEETS